MENVLSMDELKKMDAYFRAVNYLSVGQLYLLDNPLLRKPLTRSERASKAKKSTYFDKYGEQARKIIEILLDKYADGAIDDISNMDVLKLPELTDEFGTPISIVKLFGGKEGWLAATQQLSQAIYY